MKIFADDDEHKAELAKTLGGITDAVTKLSQRVEEIAKQPMPALAAGGAVLPPGVMDVSKAEDGRSVDHMAKEKPGISIEEATEIWKGMTPEQRTLLSIQASHMRPYAQRR